MAIGRREDVQGELLVCPAELPDDGGYVFLREAESASWSL